VALTKSELTSRVRRLVGNPKESQPEELSDESINEELDAALRVLDKYTPNWRIYSLTTVAYQQSYSIESGVNKVLTVYWGSPYATDVDFGEDFELLKGYSLYNPETERYERIVEWLTEAQVLAHYDWEFNAGEGKLYLLPCPTESGDDVYYIGAKPWTWDTIPSDKQDLIVRYAAAQCLKKLGRARAKLSGVQRAGGLIDYGAVDSLEKIGEREEKSVLEEIQAESNRFLMGL